MPQIHTLTLNPALDIDMFFRRPRLGALNRASSSYIEASGKGINVSQALAAHGVRSRAVVPLGGPFGGVLQTLLQGAPFALEVIPIAGASRANSKVIDEESGEMTEFNTSGPPLSADERAACYRALLDGLAEDDVVVLSGSLPPGVPPGSYGRLVRAARERGARTMVDASGEALALALAAAPALAKPNRVEAEQLLQRKIATFGEAVAAAAAIGERGAEQVVLSLGAAGAVFLSADETLIAQGPAITARSTTGCGDALLAGVLLGELRGWSWAESARYATALATARAAGDAPGFPTPVDVARYLDDVVVSTAEAVGETPLDNR